MMASPVILSAQTSEPIPASSTTATRRKVLGEPSSSRTTRSTRAPSVSEDVFSAPASQRANARMPVFVDPSGDAENDPDQATNPTPWPELGTRKTRIKENTVEVSKAAGTTLRQASRGARAPSGSRIAVFRDSAADDTAAMPPPPVPAPRKEKTRTASKSSIPVFRDDDSAGSSKPSEPPIKGKTRSASKSSISVFRDEGEPSAAASPSEAPKKAKSRTASKSSIVVFKDEEEVGDTTEPATKGKAKTGSKGSIAVFRDEEGPASNDTPTVPSTPKFVPFRDEEEVRFYRRRSLNP